MWIQSDSKTFEKKPSNQPGCRQKAYIIWLTYGALVYTFASMWIQENKVWRYGWPSGEGSDRNLSSVAQRSASWLPSVYFTFRERKREFLNKVGRYPETDSDNTYHTCEFLFTLAFLLVYKLHKGWNYGILFTSIYALCLVYRRYSIDTYCFSFPLKPMPTQEYVSCFK